MKKSCRLCLYTGDGVSADDVRNHPLKDIGLPYMMDTRHAPDSFFFIFENDFRFFEEDCLDPEVWLPTAAHLNIDADKFFEEKKEQTCNAETVETGTDDKQKHPARKRKWQPKQKDDKNGAEPSAGHTRGLGAWEFCHKPLEDEEDASKEPSPELRNLTAIANQSKRQGKGDVVWFSWNPHKDPYYKYQPSNGSQLIGMNQVGARRVLAAMNVHSGPARHFDHFLRDLCRAKALNDCASYNFSLSVLLIMI